ncbi:metallophosphoesterase family protein [Pseudonocardia sp. CA-107938]|uniref:metallophosphoesterase family protein n=1 Tax=Pseudonocardia sp. CA-107938 TaxID=3240021 RepID=UPI003D8A232F
MEPTHTLIQLTDLHVREEHDPWPTGDTLPVLERALAAVTAARPVTAVLLTGDLTEHGRPAEYRRLRSVVEQVPVPVVLVAGNHDDRTALRVELAGLAADDSPFDHVTWLDGLRVVVLDSTVPGEGHGELRPAQLEWLRAELAEPAPAGTVLALHHAPLPHGLAAAREIELRDRAALGAVLAGTDVRIVVGGHVHSATAGTLAGIPVWTSGSVHVALDSLPPRGTDLRVVVAPSLSRIDLFPDTALATSVPLDARPA